MSMQSVVVERLVALKRHALEELRKDLSTLNQLVQEYRDALVKAQTEHKEFAEEMRQTEAGHCSLVASIMLERRRYISYLQGNINEADSILADALEQEQRAQQAFDECYTEIRKLERVAERRRLTVRQETERKGYSIADDQELVRMSWSRSSNVAN